MQKVAYPNLVHPFAEPPQVGEVIEVAPGILWTRLSLPFRLDHVNIYLIDDGDGWAVLDTGLGSNKTRAMWEALAAGGHPGLAAVAGKALKEDKYHLRHSSEWVVRLGDGTAESHARVQRALDDLWRFTGELFRRDAVDEAVAAHGIALDAAAIRPRWDAIVDDVLARATLVRPADAGMRHGGRTGRHTEHLGHLLATMQIVARSHPGATW